MQEFLEVFKSTAKGMWAHRLWGLVAAILVGLIAVGISFSVPKRYEATARVYVDTQSLLGPVLKDMAVQPNFEQQVAMAGRIILSRPNVDKVMKASDLDLQVKTPREREQFIDELIRRIEFKASPGSTNLYTISYKNQRPETAKAVVQSLLGIFIEQGYGNDRQGAEKAVRFLNEQIKEAEQKLLASETSLKDFKIKNLAIMPNLQQDYVARSAETQNAVSQARLELRQAEYARDSLKRQLSEESATVGSVEVSSGNGNSNDAPTSIARGPTETDQRLDIARVRLDELKSRFTDEHPDVIGAKRSVAALEEQRATERKLDDAKGPTTAQRPRAQTQGPRTSTSPNPVFQQIKLSLAETEAQVAALRARVSDYESRLVTVRETAQTIPKVEAEYLQLTRDYDNVKKTYDNLAQRRDVAILSGAVGASSGVAEYRVVDPPRVSSLPVSPNLAILLTMSFLASIAAGLATCFLKDQTRPTFHDVRSLRQTTGLPLLGTVSYILDSRQRSRARRQAWVFSGVSGTYFLLFLGLVVWTWAKTILR
jgi:polysaccharide chain length determinant protein (PEP-CTERM system associated)